MSLIQNLDELNLNEPKPRILIIEPFYGGSHKALIDVLTSYIGAENCNLVTLPAKKWHWRARCGALMLYDLIPVVTNQRILFCSSVLNLCELLGMRNDLQTLKKVVYFHENQLVYPVKEIKERDIQYAYNQITTCLAADVVLFNSEFNKSSFLSNISKVTRILPDFKPNNSDLSERIERKCRVVYFPVVFPSSLIKIDGNNSSLLGKLHIVWPHRWEFDKGPEDFFSTLFKLKENKISFNLSILGESFTENPEIFAKAKQLLKDEIVHFGYASSKEDYYEILSKAHVVVSTAKHEFFGVAMLEATYAGCFPLAPNSLVYPEIYPKECLFSNLGELFAKLKLFALTPSLAKDARNALNINFNQYSCDEVFPQFQDIFSNLAKRNVK